jgi:ketosteroid isomerase-like protein
VSYRRAVADDAAVPDDLAAVVDAYHEALDVFMAGDPEPVAALWSRREDTTLANPFGPPVRGWAAVEPAMRRAAAHYTDGRAIGFDRVSRYATPELAYTIEIERYEARVSGSEEMTPVSARVTTVFRREEGNWRVVHRHADPITSRQSANSVLIR